MSLQSFRIDTASINSYPADAQIVIPFEPRRITLLQEDASTDSFASLDGETDDLHLVPGAPLTVEQRVREVWLMKGTTGGNVQVIAES